MHAFDPLDPAMICRRWRQADVAHNLLQWRSLGHLLAAEASMCTSSGMPELGSDMEALSKLAQQHALDLQPAREMELRPAVTPTLSTWRGMAEACAR
jgi:hypothetical protein